MDRLAQVRPGRRRSELGPEKIHHLLTLQAMARCERKQLDKGSRLSPTPLLVRNDASSDRGAKATEQIDPKKLRHADSVSRTTLLPESRPGKL
jgi:hypothetical protein